MRVVPAASKPILVTKTWSERACEIYRQGTIWEFAELRISSGRPTITPPNCTRLLMHPSITAKVGIQFKGHPPPPSGPRLPLEASFFDCVCQNCGEKSASFCETSKFAAVQKCANVVDLKKMMHNEYLHVKNGLCYSRERTLQRIKKNVLRFFHFHAPQGFNFRRDAASSSIKAKNTASDGILEVASNTRSCIKSCQRIFRRNYSWIAASRCTVRDISVQVKCTQIV